MARSSAALLIAVITGAGLLTAPVAAHAAAASAPASTSSHASGEPRLVHWRPVPYRHRLVHLVPAETGPHHSDLRLATDRGQYARTHDRKGTAVQGATLSTTTATTASPAVAGTGSNGKVLILSTTVTNGINSTEAQEAAADGYGVDVVDPTAWSALTAADFAAYRAVILGDPTCGSESAVTAAEADAGVWGPVINGNIEIFGSDPVYHQTYTDSAITAVTQRAVDFATAKAGATGAYISLSCYFAGASSTHVGLLDGLDVGGSGFAVEGAGCSDAIHIEASSPALAGIDDSLLSNWSCSVHEYFTSWPAKFGVLAVDTSAGALYTGQDGTTGNPYVLAYPGGSFLGRTETAGGGSLDGHNNQCQHGSYPVNCATGEFWHTFTDLTVPGRGPALDLARTYSSLQAGNNGPFGYGWNSTYAMSLAVDPASGAVQVTQENGSTTVFSPGPSGYTSPPRVFATLSKNADGTWTFIRHQRERFLFDAQGRLTQVSDLNGYTTTIDHDSSGHITTVSDPSGRTLSFTYDANGRISQVSDPAGRTVTYAYDAAGQLSTVTDVTGATTTFTYAADGTHLLTTMTDARGGVVTNVYDSAGRVTSQTDPAGRTTTYAYTDSGTTITDPRGVATSQLYTQGQLVETTRAAGTSQASTWKYSYDPATLALTAATDPNGNTTSYAYSGGSFDPTTVTDALGRQTTITYNGFEEPVSVTGHAGVTATYTYDSSGNLLTVSRPLTGTGQVRTSAYAHADTGHPGDVTSMTDPDGKVWTFTYDSAGDLTSRADPLGDTTTYGYDAIGRRTSTVSARGNVAGADRAAFTSTFAYDAAGDLVKSTDALGHTTRYGYDADRNRTSVTDPSGKTTSFAFDADNELTAVTEPDGTNVTYGYDAVGNMTSQTDGAGHTTSYDYTPLGQLDATTDPLKRTTTYRYDAAGNLTSLTNAAGGTTTYGYDAADQLTSIGYDDATTPGVSLTYTADGQRATMTDGAGTTSYTYDSLDRLTSQTDGSGQTIGYGYDLAGHVTSLTYPNGKTVARGYDAAGRLTTVTDWNGATTTIALDPDANPTSYAYGNGVTSNFTYDDAGQLTATTDSGPSGATLAGFAYTRNADGQLSSTTPTGVTQGNETYSYTQLNQLAGVNGAKYGYDAAGNITALADGATLSYDAAGQATSYTPAQGTPTALAYDQRGDRTNGLTPAGTPVSYTYDEAGRLTSVTGGSSRQASALLAGGEYHSVAVTSDGSVWAWGSNAYGQLGNGTTTNATTPIQVPGITSAGAVAAGDLTSYAVTSTGTVDSWGANQYGQLGIGSTSGSSKPVQLSGLTGVRDLAAGNYHALAVKADGTVVAWGLNNAGQLGDGSTTTRTAPVAVHGLSNIVQVAAGGLPGYAGQSVALASDGTVWTWGYGKSGQLGLGTNTSTGTPTRVPGLSGITQIAASGDDTYALAQDGTVWAWGDNSYGQIGNTSAGHTQSTPVKVAISGVSSIAAGGTHALAIKSDGTVWAWGDNNTGQLGDGAACGKTCTVPVQAAGLAGATAVAAGYVHSLAATAVGAVYGWGRNAEGEIGDGTTTVRTTPTRTNTLSTVKPVPAVDVHYVYNGDGLRTSRTTPSGSRHFAWTTTTTGVPVLLSDGSTSYLYDDSGTPLEQISSTGTTLYLQHDYYGSTRLLTDSNGAVAATFSYNPYGALTGRTGTADTPLRWNGQYQDSDTGLYYLRARYYDPATAQFLSRDPLTAHTQSPYGYGFGNPLEYADPNGLCSWYDVVCDAGAAAGWVGDHASDISAVTGVAAVLIMPIPGLDALSPVLGAISVATGAYATGKDVANGNWGQAAVDLTGTLLGGAGLVEDIGAKLTMSAAREAWDEGLPVLDLARAAEQAESWGGWLDKVAAGVAVVGDLTDRYGVFEGDPESEAGGPDAASC